MNEYLDIDNVGYLCTKTLHTFIVACLDATQRSQDCVKMKGLPGNEM